MKKISPFYNKEKRKKKSDVASLCTRLLPPFPPPQMTIERGVWPSFSGGVCKERDEILLNPVERRKHGARHLDYSGRNYTLITGLYFNKKRFKYINMDDFARWRYFSFYFYWANNILLRCEPGDPRRSRRQRFLAVVCIRLAVTSNITSFSAVMIATNIL